MEPQLGDSFKVCGFCSQLTDEVETMSRGLISFLERFLGLPAARLPTKLCPDCLKRAINARKFQDKCLKAFEKLEKNGIRGGMVWGREVESLGTGGLEYNRRLHGPLKFPLISLTATDRAMAEAHLKTSARRERLAKRRKENLQHQSDSDESQEVFPAVGPFQCEMCQEISGTKQDFVNHIKANHRDFIDPEVLGSLESDLKIREKKILKKREKSLAEKSSVVKKSGKSQSVKKKPKVPTKKSGKIPSVEPKKSKKRKLESGSDEEFIFSVAKKNYSGYTDLQYIDEEGNPLPKSAGKGPGLCNVCGKTLGRANEMFKHQQTLSCRAVASEKGQEVDEKAKDILVVVVKNYQGPRLDPETETPTAPIAPIFKAEEKKEEPEDPEEDLQVDEKVREVEETLRAVVEEWNREENDVNSNLTKEQRTKSKLVEEKKTEKDKALTEVQDEKCCEERKISVLSPAEGKYEVEKKEKDINSNASAVHRDKAEEEEDVVDDAVVVTAEEEQQPGSQLGENVQSSK